jgi:peroxiredoxin
MSLHSELTQFRTAWEARVGAEIEAMGAALVAVSPERPDHSLSTAEKNDLRFAVLSDVGGALASALGIRFALSEAARPFYEKAGHALPDRNGDGDWALPMPASFVIARGGRIALAAIEPDYRKRLEPRAALDALHALHALTEVVLCRRPFPCRRPPRR